MPFPKMSKLVLSLCLACLALGLFASLSREEVRATLRRLQVAPETKEVAEAATESVEEVVEVVEVKEASNQTMEEVESAAEEEEPEANVTDAELPELESNESASGVTLAFPKVWAGNRHVVGVESCYGRTTGYCNALMYRAKSMCGGSGCVLIVNPAGHRTRTPLHIHAYGYNGAGAALKSRMSRRVCKRSGWQSGGFPCGGRAKFFHGFPPVFSVAKGAGSISHASITAWPGSCGYGTIVLVSFGCSIEHSISQR